MKEIFISENSEAASYKVLPVKGMVLGFQYAGALSLEQDSRPTKLSQAGLTGFTDKYRIYSNTAGIGTVLVYFTELGISKFIDCPAIDLFGESVSLDAIFPKDKVSEASDRLMYAQTDSDKIHIVERFLLSQLKDRGNTQMLQEAVRWISDSKGTFRIKDLSKHLYTSASVLERRFKNHIGITPKKFASVVRFNNIVKDLQGDAALIDICYHNNYFDQSHFIKDFKAFTGSAPEQFRRSL